MRQYYYRSFCLVAGLLFLLGFSAILHAQTPQYYNYNSGGSGNTFPFGQTAGKMVQWLFLPGAFSQPTPLPAGDITAVYFLMYGSGARTYTNLAIKMAQTTDTDLTDGQFYSGSMTTVYFRASVTLTSPGANQWLGPIYLDTAFAYDPSLSLVLSVEQAGSSGSGMYIQQHSLSGTKRVWSVGGAPYVPYTSGDARNCDFGVDIGGGVLPPDAETYAADLITSTTARVNGWGDPQGVNGDANFAYRELGAGSFSYTPIQTIGPAAQDFNDTISGLTPGTTYEFQAEVSNPGGSDTGDLLTFTTPGEDLRAAAGSHRTICQGEQTVLGAYPPVHGGTPPYQYDWTSNPAGFTSNAPHPAVSPSSFTAYTLTVTDATMVTAQSTVMVYVAAYLTTPALLTPGDGSTLPDLEALLAWGDVADEIGYVLHINDNMGHFWHIDVPANQTTWLIDETAGILSRGASYDWYVEALADGSMCNSQQGATYGFSIEGLPEPCTQAFIYAAKGLHKAGLGSCRTNLGLTSVDSANQFATLNLRNSNGRLLDTVDLAVGYNTFAAYADILERFPSAYLEGTIDIQSPDRVFVVGGLVDNTSNDPSMYPRESEAGPHIFTPLVLRNLDWTSQVVLRNLSDQELTVELTNYSPGSGVVSAQRTIVIGAMGYFKSDDIMQYMADPLPYALFTAQVVQGSGDLTGCARQVSSSHTGGIYPFWQVDSGVHGAVLPYVCDTAEHRSSMGLCNTSGQAITITAQLVSAGSIIDQQDYPVAPMSYLAVADVAAFFRAGKGKNSTQGYMRLSSVDYFHAIGGIIDKQTNDPSVYGMQQPFTAAFSPLVIRTSQWQTCLVLANDGQNPVDVLLTLYTDGQPLGTVPVTVPGMCVLRLDDVMSLFATQADYGTLFIDPAAPVYGVVIQQTNQGTGGVYPLYYLD